MKKIALAIASALLFFAFPVSAVIIHVPQDLPTIQSGINATVNGDTVLVRSGGYSENITITNKNLVITSEKGADSTFIIPPSRGLAVTFNGTVDTTTIFSGFTVGGADYGIWCGLGARPRILNNIVTNNSTYGIYCPNTSPIIRFNLITKNTSAGIWLITSNASIINNTIVDNSGFGILCGDASFPLIKNNVLARSTFGGFGIYTVRSIPTLVYNDVWNHANNYFCAEGPCPVVGTGSISANPEFVGGTPFSYELKVNSPCIDAGDPSSPVPPNGGVRIDMGAFEFPKNNSAPTIPQPVLPTNGAEANSTTYLIWQRSRDQEGNTIRYTLQIDNDSSFATPIITADSIPDSNTLNLSSFGNAFVYAAASTNFIGVQLNGLTGFNLLQDDSTYFWRVKATDIYGQDSGYSSGSKNFVLNLINSPPRPVTAGFSPANGSYENDLTPEISWFPASDPDPSDNPSTLHYNLQLDDDGEFSVDVRYQYATSAGQTSFFVTDSLTDTTQWYYRVQTVDDEGATSNYSAIQNFFTNSRNNPPSSFSLVSPSTDSKLFSKTPTLDWADAIDPDPLDTVTYSVIIDADSLFGNPVTISQLPASSYTVASGLLSRGNRYFWKVKATDSRDSSTFSTEIFKFRILQLGDANGDGSLTSADIVLILNYVFLGIPITPPEIADMNCDAVATSSDVVLALNNIFLGQPPPCDP